MRLGFTKRSLTKVTWEGPAASPQAQAAASPATQLPLWTVSVPRGKILEPSTGKALGATRFSRPTVNRGALLEEQRGQKSGRRSKEKEGKRQIERGGGRRGQRKKKSRGMNKERKKGKRKKGRKDKRGRKTLSC